MGSKTLTLKKAPDPAKIAQSLQIGFRFIDRKGRYILQKQLILYPCDGGKNMNGPDYTWIDIPLCPETYGEGQA